MDLRFVRHSVAALLCAVALTSCGFSTTDRVLRKMSEAQFILPEGCLSVDGGHVSIYSPDSIAKAKFVIFYGPEECGSCRIDRLEGRDTLYRLAETRRNFDVQVIFSPSQEQVQEIMELLRRKAFKWPVLVDVQGTFMELNDFVPDDNRFHYFLTDVDGSPVFVGNPLYSNSLWNLFIRAVDSL